MFEHFSFSSESELALNCFYFIFEGSTEPPEAILDLATSRRDWRKCKFLLITVKNLTT